MAPTIRHVSRQRDSRAGRNTNSGRRGRNANTNAGVDRHRSNASRGGRGHRRGQGRNRAARSNPASLMLGRYVVVREDDQPQTEASTGAARPSLLSRMTFPQNGVDHHGIQSESQASVEPSEVDDFKPDDDAMDIDSETPADGAISPPISALIGTQSEISEAELQELFEDDSQDEPPAQSSAQSSPQAPKSSRPVNTYKGKDPIKRLVSNKNLRAIFAGKPYPKERKRYPAERMELRMGHTRIMR